MRTEDWKPWAESLLAQLSGLDEVFRILESARCGRSTMNADEENALGVRSDGADIPHQYARVLTRIIEALEVLPGFEDGRGLDALQALRLDLMALDEGNRAQRLTPVPRDSRPGTPVGRRVYMAQVILCVRLLEEIGCSGSNAREETARIFGEFKHRGQQGEKLSAETLTRWREAVLHDEVHAAGRRMIDRKLRFWRADPNWPPSMKGIVAYISNRASRPVISLAASK